jgi:hypothetical protein
VAVLAAASLAAQGPRPLADGTREMAAELARRAAALTTDDLWFNINDKRAVAFAKDVDKPRSVVEALRARHVYANELLFAARYADAIAETDKLLDQVEAIGFVGAKTAKCLIDEEYVSGKNKRGWYISFSDDGGAGDYNIWNKIKELDMRMMITGVKISGFYGNRVLELMNDGKNAKRLLSPNFSEPLYAPLISRKYFMA